ncbi:NAD(P)-dependent dehydrogenase, short-chain alcohol dehydrogenase family [Lentzea fradiae]|uniref:NAD(P)-dependent dehydrogenase, short-chain alcohol dehydrogenase family n=1 Tax=Lentzea fradiae TaxID=200378 RepID=A0A1G7NGH9_9PSEU|nr:SDR family NAD(P)-dependent oxidoreductase [Lentzea fradiae]SDF73205.1 NAD(P)-dependent dehydrogenase, short-chain alcohol dehydrogenase family [Lentzea fradiae]
MDLQLEGKRVLVTGASRGIGLAIVHAFLAEGASVVATARRATPELAATEAVFVPADLATPDGPAKLVDAVLALDPRLDVLVNNAGGAERADRVFDDPMNGDDDTWANVFALNLSSAVRTTRAALPALTKARGAVVNISSASARYPHTSPLPYSAAKAALNAFTRGLAEATGKAGVRVNAVTPSGTRTDLMVGAGSLSADLAELTGVDQAELEKGLPEQFGMLTKDLVDPAEIARAVVLLASPTMPSAIGSNWTVDGGTLKTA